MTCPGRTRRRRCASGEKCWGKDANQAVAMAQPGLRPAVVGVVGDDAVADRLPEQLGRAGMEATWVVRRPGAATGLVVDVVDSRGRWHYLEHLPPEVLLRATDLVDAARAPADVDTVIQLQQPTEVALAATLMARWGATRIVLDGAPQDGQHRAALLAEAACCARITTSRSC
jgi:ribokinase